jgi:glycosyltransferase involved in cell wall biosynthesis
MMARIAVDFTNALIDLENDGADLFAVELLRGFQKVRDHYFLVLTSYENHNALSFLDAPNMKRIRLDDGRGIGPVGRLVNWMKTFRNGGEKDQKRFQVLQSLKADIFFCPFTSPENVLPGTPVISVIHDFKQRELPHLFDKKKLDLQDELFHLVKRRADYIVCVSENVRRLVLEHLGVNPDRTVVIPKSVHGRLKIPADSEAGKVLSAMGLGQNPYFFYPADFLPDKNHRMLLTALAMYLSKNPDKTVDLVLSGQFGKQEVELTHAASKLGLKSSVHFFEHLSEKELSAVWKGCLGLIFPSLYEGFPVALLEAMHFGKPVLCGNCERLRELAGEAALFFDPRNPYDIVDCIDKIVGNKGLIKDLENKGKDRAVLFQPEDMIEKYREVFKSSLQILRDRYLDIAGVYEDGWTKEEIRISAYTGIAGWALEMNFALPEYVPMEQMKLELKKKEEKNRKWELSPGESLSIVVGLPKKYNQFRFSVLPTFQPWAYGLGEDRRQLGLVCTGVRFSMNKQEPEL